jgi:hypothetical protein
MNHPAASCEVSHFRDFIDFIEANFEKYNPKRFNKIKRDSINAVEIVSGIYILKNSDRIQKVYSPISLYRSYFIVRFLGDTGASEGETARPSYRSLAGIVPSIGLTSGPMVGHGRLPKNAGLFAK